MTVSDERPPRQYNGTLIGLVNQHRYPFALQHSSGRERVGNFDQVELQKEI